MRHLSKLWILPSLFGLLLLGCPDPDSDDDSADDDDYVGEDCVDEDGDSYRVGDDCLDSEQQDCNDEDADENWDDSDGDGWTTCDDDCDDNNADVYPDADEICNGEDEDCDGDVDEDFDNDNDGFVDGDNDDCVDAYAEANLDCDDSDEETNPEAYDVCDGDDNDCDGEIDENSDMDGDGYTSCGDDGVAGTSDDDCMDSNPEIYPEAVEECDNTDNDCDGDIDEDFDQDGDGHIECHTDCDDHDANTYVGAPELCDGVDNDCDGMIDEGFDTDGDGFVAGPNGECDAYLAPEDQDCDDGDAAVYPGAPEQCNGIDDDCDGTVDEDEDADGDGYFTCQEPEDCDDTDANVFPGATEACNGYDDNCDGVVDEGFDADGDGYTTCNGDCDDGDAAVNPGMTEVAGNGIDDDCDGTVDESVYCNPYEPVDAVGAVKVYDLNFPMFGTGTETITIGAQTTFEGFDVFPLAGVTDIQGMTFDYYMWCDPADGAVYKYGMEAGLPKYGTLTETETPGRMFIPPAADIGTGMNWSENTVVAYDMGMAYDMDTTVDYFDLGPQAITVGGTPYTANHFYVEYEMIDNQGYLGGNITGTYDIWVVEDIGIVRYWYEWTNPLNNFALETLFTKEMVSVTMP